MTKACEKNPNCLVTGGLSGIGKDIVDYFPHSKGVGRRNGYDIRDKNIRSSLIQESLDYDIFVNLAHDGEFAQTKLLYELFDHWETQKKIGYIINIGSIATYNVTQYKRFSILKFALDTASHQCSKKISDQDLPFRCTILRPGLLDLPKSREKESWRTTGVRGQTLSSTIEFLWNLPEDQQINDMVIEAIQKSRT